MNQRPLRLLQANGNSTSPKAFPQPIDPLPEGCGKVLDGQRLALAGVGRPQKHDVCLWAADSGKSEALTIKHLPATLREWINGLRERFGGGRIAICLEQSKGPLIHALMGYEFLVLYPINPRTLA